MAASPRWFLVEVGEIALAGDEFFDTIDWRWYPLPDKFIGEAVGPDAHPIRRRTPAWDEAAVERACKAYYIARGTGEDFPAGINEAQPRHGNTGDST